VAQPLDWDIDAHYIREWARGGCVPTDRLVVELLAWADHFASPIESDVAQRSTMTVFEVE